MPIYSYQCKTHGEFELVFKTLPSEKRQKKAKCPDCGKVSKRNIAVEFNHVGAHSSKDLEMSAAMAAKGGIHKDENGNMNEMRTSRDLDKWAASNQLGTPRMTEWTNPKTGQKSWVPMREKMIADPSTGEPMDGPVVRESAKMIPLPNNYIERCAEKTGLPLNDKGVVENRDPKKAKLGILDPVTRKPMTVADCWGGSGKDVPSGRAKGVGE